MDIIIYLMTHFNILLIIYYKADQVLSFKF